MALCRSKHIDNLHIILKKSATDKTVGDGEAAYLAFMFLKVYEYQAHSFIYHEAQNPTLLQAVRECKWMLRLFGRRIQWMLRN